MSKTQELPSPAIEIALVSGVEGGSLYINDYRVAGTKPWGGGTVTKRWTVPKERLLKALENCPSKKSIFHEPG